MSSLTINLDLGSYDATKIVYKQATSNDIVHTKECIIGKKTTLSQAFAYDTAYPVVYTREIQITATTVIISNGYAQGGGATGASKPNSAVCIPTHIYGCKL